ncbi:NACHT domain-containing protein [Streptomyces sp. HNM0575]|uniref:NACHT domain-containing protein n=1 Tax=Streptomyces sp. HNM0575 TaxID=2716338 RepID=UPI00145F5B62|nr:NACHT domain-containing protein [Streptomyces sp. HNM0575]
MTEQRGVHNSFSGSATYVIQAGNIFGDVRFHGAPAETPQDAAARELAGAVHARWRDEAAARGLADRAQPEVRWTADPASADHEVNVGAAVPVQGDGLAALTAAYRSLPARRLVILGGPGAGKTSLAVLLSLELLRDWTSGAPVPVIVPVWSWDPDREHLHAWLARRVHQDHGTRRLDRRRVRELVRDRRVLPVLDGFDELPAPARAKALSGLNRALAGDAPLILTSRTEEYAEAAESEDVLASAAVVRAEPVPAAAAADFLRRTSHPGRAGRWEELLAALTAGDAGLPVVRALSSPLMLWLTRTVYAGPDAAPGELLDRSRFPGPAAVERHLLDSLVPATFPTGPASPDGPRSAGSWGAGSRGPGSRGAARAERWLGFLARHLTRLGTREFAWWRLHRARLPSVLGVPALFLGTGLLLFAMAGLTAWSTRDAAQRGAVAEGAAGALALALMGGIVHRVLLAVRGDDLPQRPAGLLRRWRPHLAAVLAVVLAFASAVQFLLQDGPLAVLAIVLPGLLMLVLGVPADPDRAFGPGELLDEQRRSTLLTLSLVSPALGAVGAVAATGRGTETVVATWVVGSVAAAGTILLLSPWSHWLLTRSVLAAVGALPWRLTAFLAEAHRVGVLRQAAGTWQFRHGLLQERLAAPAAGGRWRMAVRRRVGAEGPVRSEGPVRAEGPVREVREDAAAAAPEQVSGARPAEPAEVRIPGGSTGRRRWARAGGYALPWGLAALRVAQMGVERDWDAGGVWLLVGFLVLLPVVLELSEPSIVRGRAELRLNPEVIGTTSRGRTVSVPWADVAEVAVRGYEGASGTRSRPVLHVRLHPWASPGPGLRADSAGWIAFWPLGGRAATGEISPELRDALGRFAGSAWSAPGPPVRPGGPADTSERGRGGAREGA